VTVARTSTLPKRLQPMLATLTDAPFDDKGWIFEDKYDGFRMVATIEGGKVTLYSRNGKIISQNYIDVAKALEGVNGDAVIDGELVALDNKGVSHFQLLQNARRDEAKLQYCPFDLMFQDGEDLRDLPLLERKKRLKSVLPRHKLIAFSRHRVTFGTRFFEEAERKGLEGIMAKLANSKYLSGARTDSWLKIKTSKRQEVVIAGFIQGAGALRRASLAPPLLLLQPTEVDFGRSLFRWAVYRLRLIMPRLRKPHSTPAPRSSGSNGRELEIP
jgi:bifunctional non-homologous end joining protein LigD